MKNGGKVIKGFLKVYKGIVCLLGNLLSMIINCLIIFYDNQVSDF